jgi:ABC-type multidrug transport system fused ATPase/permease subunit
MDDSPDIRQPLAPLPWRRVWRLLGPVRGGLAAMVALSTGGVLVGLVPALALGVLVGALVERNDRGEAALLAALIVLAVAAEAAAYIASDTLYARNAARLYRNLRVDMFDAALRRHDDDPNPAGGLASRFISDAEAIGATVSLLDRGSMQIVEFASALVALGLLAPPTVPVVVAELALTWVVTRLMQEPAAAAGQRRQEELERMTRALTRELAHHDAPRATTRFAATVERVLRAEIQLGWLQALNLQGSGGLAKLGPIAAVIAAAVTGLHHAGTLIALYLLAQRAYWGFDGLVDLSLSIQSTRGAIARCLALTDTTTHSTTPRNDRAPRARDLNPPTTPANAAAHE